MKWRARFRSRCARAGRQGFPERRRGSPARAQRARSRAFSTNSHESDISRRAALARFARACGVFQKLPSRNRARGGCEGQGGFARRSRRPHISGGGGGAGGYGAGFGVDNLKIFRARHAPFRAALRGQRVREQLRLLRVCAPPRHRAPDAHGAGGRSRALGYPRPRFPQCASRGGREPETRLVGIYGGDNTPCALHNAVGFHRNRARRGLSTTKNTWMPAAKV